MSVSANHRSSLEKPHSDPDSDWMQEAEALPAALFSTRLRRSRFIPAFPLGFLQQAQVVGDALSLLLVALAEMRMRRAGEVALGPRLWGQVGNPTKRVRTRLLRQLGRLPPNVGTVIARQGRPHLLKAGIDWPRAIQPRQSDPEKYPEHGVLRTNANS